MTKEKFVAEWQEMLIGYSLAAFAQNEKGDMATKGRWIIHQMQRAREIAERMFDQLATETLDKLPTLEKPAAKVAPTLDSVVADARTLPHAAREEMLGMLLPLKVPTLESVMADAVKLAPASKAELLKRLTPSDNGKPKEMAKTMAAK